MSAPPRVLLVDDVEPERRLVRRALERSGRFEVVAEAADGYEAIVLAHRLQPDIILLDLSMPVMDGLQALPELRFGAPAACIVIHSGVPPQVLDGYGGPAPDGFVEKGMAAVDLVDVLLAVFDRHHVEPAELA